MRYIYYKPPPPRFSKFPNPFAPPLTSNPGSALERHSFKTTWSSLSSSSSSTSTQFWGCPLRWRHNEHDGVSNHQPHGCLLNRLFRRRSKKTSNPRVTGLCVGNSPGPVNSPHKGPVTRKMFPFDDVIMPDTAHYFMINKDTCSGKTLRLNTLHIIFKKYNVIHEIVGLKSFNFNPYTYVLFHAIMLKTLSLLRGINTNLVTAWFRMESWTTR